MKHKLFLAAIALFMTSCSSETNRKLTPVTVEVANTESGYRLMRNGEPYTIKGAGMAVDDIEAFAAHGGNSIRNWSTTAEYQDTQDLLDSAHANGVTVALGLPMQAERWGFDYDNAGAVAGQLVKMREEVLKYRDHPALLFWMIGNELNHSYSNPRVYDAVNDVAEMIHTLDPNHPATTTLSGFEVDVIAEIQARAPALDFISLQTYGSLFGLPGFIAASGFDEPFMVTEWGTLGYWEMQKTAWGAPIELTSSEKADVIMRGHRDVLARFKGQLIGSYVFFWGQKQERTPTWFGLLTENGEETEAVDVMHYIWNDGWPDNRAPRVMPILLDGRTAKQSVSLAPGEIYEAAMTVADDDNNPLRYRWEIKPESDATQTGGDFEESLSSLDDLITDPTSATTTVTAPDPGKYRLFAYAYDGHDHAAHANIPFSVDGDLVQAADELLAGQLTAAPK